MTGAQSTRPFELDDAMRLRFVSEAGFVPGGERCFYGVSGVDRARREATLELWLLDRASGRHERVAGLGGRPRSARPSPDGTRLAFVDEVDGVAQLCALTFATGVVEPLTDLPQGVVGAPAWSPDGRRIAFTAPPAPRRDPSEPYRVDRWTIRFEGIGMIDDALQDIFVLELETGAVRQLTDDRAINVEPRFSPDGARLLFVASFAPEVEWRWEPSAVVIDLASGERRTVVEGRGGVTAADWCPDGERIVFAGARDAPGMEPIIAWHKQDLWTVELAGGEPVCRTEGLLAGVATWLEFDHPTQAFFNPSLRVGASGDVVYATAQRGCDVGVVRVGLAGEERVEPAVAPAGRACFLHDVGGDGDELLYVSTSLTDPPELMLRSGEGEQRVTTLNDAVVREVTKPIVTELEIVAPDGLSLEGRSLTPPGEGPFPTVLCIHGGPCDAYGSVYMIDWQLLVGAGIAVVFGNFRGTGGYGDAFHQALGDAWGELGEQDHHATIDRAIELGIADPERLGVYGLSHGAFATCWLAGRSDRFHVAVAENPIVNLASGYCTADSSFWISALLGASPDEAPERYAARSPLTYAPQCRTPLLFVVGERDERTVPFESEQYYRVLKATGCPSEMLRLPNANHLGSWSGPVPARMAQNEALVEWFSRYLKPEAAEVAAR